MIYSLSLYSLNLVNATNQCQMSPKNGDKRQCPRDIWHWSWTFGIDWGQMALTEDKMALTGDKWHWLRGHLAFTGFKPPHVLRDKCHWPVNAKCPSIFWWGTPLIILIWPSGPIRDQHSTLSSNENPWFQQDSWHHTNLERQMELTSQCEMYLP